MADEKKFELDKPQYNSTLKLIKKLDDIKFNKLQVQLTEDEIERIHEKAAIKLNLRGPIYDGLVSVEPDEDDFLKYLELKSCTKKKSQINNNKNINQKSPDLMEFYPNDLVKEFPEVELDQIKQNKSTTLKSSNNFSNDPIEKYFKWN